MTQCRLPTEFLLVTEHKCIRKFHETFECMHKHAQNRHLSSANFGNKQLQNKLKGASTK
jgi:hypothetical protein